MSTAPRTPFVRGNLADYVANSVRFTVINGEGKSDELVEHLRRAAEVVRDIITAGTDIE